MTDVTLDAAVGIPEEVIFRELDGEAVVLNLDTGIYFGLDEVGTRIWQLLAEHRTLRPVWQAMTDEFDTTPDRLQKDLLAFVDELRGKGLVSVG
jgi:hypothetical protein